jgi:hypothetical protein
MLLMLDNPQQVERIAIGGIKSQNLAVKSSCFAQVSCLVKPNSLLE